MRKLIPPVAAAFYFVSSASWAAIDAAVTDKLEEVTTDVSTIGAAVLVIMLAIMAFKYLRKAL